jgi:hypothetical protein
MPLSLAILVPEPALPERSGEFQTHGSAWASSERLLLPAFGVIADGRSST